MRSLVESLKRLYKSGKVSAEKIKGMKILTEEEKRYILGEKKIKQISSTEYTVLEKGNHHVSGIRSIR